jgi:hypothetical protein
MALLGEQGRGNRRIDAAGHGDYDAHRQQAQGPRPKAQGLGQGQVAGRKESVMLARQLA